MNVRTLAIAAVALAGAVGTTFAEARDRSDVQFSVQIGQPAYGGWVRPAPVVRPAWGRDRDHDGIPNRYDRVYNPRWDRDGDGIPNRRDPHRNWNARTDGRYDRDGRHDRRW